ncbi:MAG: DoxX family protein [Devosia sp.]
MNFDFHWAILLTGFLGLAFLGNGVVNAIGPQVMRDNYQRWGFPKGWHLVNGAVCLIIGALLLVPALRPFGFILATLECIAIYATIIWNRDIGHLVPSMVLLVLLGLAYWGLYGIAAAPLPGF